MKLHSLQRSLLSLLGALILVPTSLWAEGAVPTVVARPITKVPYTITQPGTYILRKDLSYAGNLIAITVAANNVIIDLGGRTLSGTLTQDTNNSSVGITMGVGNFDSVMVRNGTIKGFAYNVNLFTGTPGGRYVVEDVVSENAGTTGIRAVGGSIEVKNCTVLNTGFKADLTTCYGIQANGKDVVIQNNTVREVKKTMLTSFGIHVNATDSALAKDNQVSSTTAGTTGIYLTTDTTSDGCFADGNYISNFATGLDLPTGGKYANNLTRGCTTAFSGGTAVGTGNN